MVELMRFTGMRPGEACNLTLGQIDRSGTIWAYRPQLHKSAYRGKERTILFGPNARRVLVEFLRGRSLDPSAPLFSPRRQREERFSMMPENRKSKLQPSQVNRKKAKPKKLPKDKYCPRTIAVAIRASAAKAGVPHWFAYQLRHGYGTKVRKEFGIEAAGAALGHTKMSATEVYAKRDGDLAAEVATKIG